MDKRFFTCVGIIFASVVLGFLAYNNLEIYQRNRYISPSREVSANLYHAMEQWLKEAGHVVSIENYFYPQRLIDAQEKVVMINSARYHWNDKEEIIRWIEKGGYFIIVVEFFNGVINENLADFLSRFGISAEYVTQRVSHILDEEGEDSFNEEKEASSETDIMKNEQADILSEEETLRDLSPNFFSRIAFHVESEEDFILIKDAEGVIRLADISLGNGMLTVTGMPVYMYNNNLKKEANAKLAWNITGARLGEDAEVKSNSAEVAAADILFIRPQTGRAASGSLLGAIFERGNFIPVIVSAVLLIITGFWMVIPGFGLVFEEKKRISRPLKDRFTAEISFLKKHRALKYYLDTYRYEQNTDSIFKSENSRSNREAINAIRMAHNIMVNDKSNRLSKNK